MKISTQLFFAAAVSLAAVRPSSAAARRAFSDAEIVGVVGAANQGELDAAGLASGKAHAAAVKEFAAEMNKDHGDAKRELAAAAAKAGVTPSDTPLSNNLTKHASEEAGQLGYLSGDAFDRAYADAQVEDHSALLKILDEQLNSSAEAEPVAALLRELRPVVAHHLEMARGLQAALTRSGK